MPQLWEHGKESHLKKTAVLVTTKHRGVFFGYATEKPDEHKTLSITEARNCVFWSSDVKGFLGLAASGPSKSCRVGPAVPELELHDVTAVAKVTPEAEEKWNQKPWSL